MNTKFAGNSTTSRNRAARVRLPAQRGAALIVALVILVVLTLLGLSSVHTVTVEERMSANTLDRALAFQMAEAGLRVGEQGLEMAKYAVDGVIENWCVPSMFSGRRGIPSVEQLLAAAGNEASAAPPENLTVECAFATRDEGWVSTADPDAWIVSDEQRFFRCPEDMRAGKMDEFNCLRFRITAKNDGENRANVDLESIYIDTRGS